MRRRRWIVLAACLSCGAQVLAQGAIEPRLASLETLIERSSAAREVEASPSPEARAARTRAREALQAARGANASGDAALAERQLAEARQQMMQAVRLAAPAGRLADQAKVDFERRLESTRALIAAQKRVSAEKKTGADALRSAEERLAAALETRGAGRMDAARAQLEEAYLISKASLGSMRGGDTLVRSLSFETKEDEYRYEVDRNDTHQMLLRVLLDSRTQAGQAAVGASAQRARELRAQAEAAARRGEHAAAVRLLEDSTGELVKAIRGAGVYIPG
ncbi:MAG: hypothetical protein ACJ8G5_11315 [Burkholderiales bacterium]